MKTSRIFTITLLGVFLCLSVCHIQAFGDSREERPIHLSIFVTAYEQAIYLSPATFGYNINKNFFVGFISDFWYPSSDNMNESTHDCTTSGSGTSEYFGQRGKCKNLSKTSYKNAIELRVYPWELGFYAGVGILNSGQTGEKYIFDTRQRTIGKNVYNSNLIVEFQEPSWSGLAYSFGFSHVFSFGLSLGIGMLFGVNPEKSEVEIYSTNGDTVAASDLEMVKNNAKNSQIAKYRNERNIVCSGIGFNF